MIFNNNTTSLNGIEIPMAEGYDCSTGIATALIESVQNDYNMFKAMLEVEAREIQINNNTDENGCINESEIISLQEASIKGIWNKIVELFRKLVAKIKSIFKSFFDKITVLFAKDQTLVKKFEGQVKEKADFVNKNMKFKYRPLQKNSQGKTSKDIAEDIFKVNISKDTFVDKDFNDTEEAYQLFNKVCGATIYGNKDEWSSSLFTSENVKETTLNELGNNINNVVEFMKKAKDNSNDAKGKIKDYISKLEKLVNELKKEEKNAEKASKDDNASDAVKSGNDVLIKATTSAYKVASAYQTGVLFILGQYKNDIKNEYKQNKAIFAKAIMINPDKYNESVIYADAVAEAAEDEVDNVINTSIENKDGNVEDVSNADTTIVDSKNADNTDKIDDESKDCNPAYEKLESAYFSELIFN